MSIREELFKLKDEQYAAFQAKLMPTVDRSKVIGVRVPLIRKIAKEYKNTREAELFLCKLPHEYYDEDLLHGFLISEINSFESCISALEDFLPYIDNWAVCDTLSPPIFKKHRNKLLPLIRKWIRSGKPYTVRYGIGMLMKHFLDEGFKEDMLGEVAAIRSDEYYVKMMVAWYFATALAKQWDTALPYLEEHRLCEWVHQKTIQKACESYRIAAEQKAILKKLRSKKEAQNDNKKRNTDFGI